MPCFVPLPRGPRVARFALASSLALLASSPAAAGEPLTGFHREWVWSVPGRGIGAGGLELADLDGDGRLDILLTSDTNDYYYDRSARWEQFRLAGSLRQTWSSLPYADDLYRLRVVATAPTPEIAVARGNFIDVHDGATKDLLRTIPITATEMTAFEVADIDGQGGLEVIACDPGALYAYDYQTGAEIAVKYGFECTDLALGQTDADAALEIALAGNAFGGLLLDGATLELDWAYLSGFGERVRLSDVDHDGADEIVGASGDQGALRAIEPGTGAVLWQRTIDWPGALESADVDGNGDEEILFGDYDYGTVYLLDESTGAELWAVPSSWSEVVALAAGDVDGDGGAELVLSTSSYSYVGRLTVWDIAGRVLEAEAQGLGGPFPGVLVGDVEADGRIELVATSTTSIEDLQEAGGRHQVFDLSSRTLEYLSPPIPSAGYDQAIQRTILVQIDVDPSLELCTAFQSDYYDGGVRCEDGATHAIEWEVQFPESAMPRSLLAAELDGDPSPELVVGTDSAQVFALEGESGWLKWQAPSFGVWADFTILRQGNVIGDSALEIVAGASDQYDDPIVVLASETGALLAGPWDRSVMALDLAQLDADPELEIVCGTVDGSIAVLDPVSGQLGAALASYPDPISALRVSEVTRDDVPDVILVANGILRVWGGAEGVTVWNGPFLGDAAARNDTLWVGNYDLDSVPDIAVNTGDGFAIFEAPLFELFLDGFESGDTTAWTSSLP
jgi:outer membrane protein assembly factor BamB